MQITLTGQHLEITDPLRAYVEEKLGRLNRHFENMTGVHVVLKVEKTRQQAEATVSLAGATLFAEAEAEDMYAAIDALADKLERQVIRHKEKLTDHRRGDAPPEHEVDN